MNLKIEMESNNSLKFMKWYIDWYKTINQKMNITFSLPNQLAPFKEENVVILDLFEKIEQSIDAKPYLNKIIDKADELGVTIYLEPMPRYKYFLKNLEKRKKISKDYLINYYQKFGFKLTPNKDFMKRIPKDNNNIKKKALGGALLFTGLNIASTGYTLHNNVKPFKYEIGGL